MNSTQTSIFTKFRPSSITGKKGSIYFRFIRKRKVKEVTLPHKVYPEEWNSTLSSIRVGSFNSPRERELQDIYLDLKQTEERIRRKIIQLEKRGDYSLSELVDYCHNQSPSISQFVEELVLDLEKSKQYRLAEAYRVTSQKLITFNKGKEVLLSSINSEFMRDYEKYMKRKGNSQNTISFYNRNTRAIYNKAVKRGIIERQIEDPFADVFTSVAKTRKRAVTQDVLDELMKLDLSITEIKPSGDCPEELKALKKSTVFARDMFILSFYLRGISFIDLAYLKKNNLKNNCITYIRSKTGQYFEIELNARIREIIQKYAFLCENSELLLPILSEGTDRKEYKNALKRQNDHLKTLSGKIGLMDKKLTTYVARHSWASIAYDKGYPITIISQGLGHESEKTTRIYLDSFDYTFLHIANDIITNLSKKKIERQQKLKNFIYLHSKHNEIAHNSLQVRDISISKIRNKDTIKSLKHSLPCP